MFYYNLCIYKFHIDALQFCNVNYKINILYNYKPRYDLQHTQVNTNIYESKATG